MQPASISIIQTIVLTTIYLIVFRWQRQQIAALTNSVNTQKSAIEAQEKAVAALRTQADGQVAITSRLEAIVDLTGKHAYNVLEHHEKVMELIKDRATLEKNKISDELEEVRAKLVAREKNIEEASIEPEIASILKSLSQENFSVREVLSSLKSEINEFSAFTNSILSTVQPILATQLELEIRKATCTSVGPGYLNFSPGDSMELSEIHRKVMRLRVRKIYKEVIDEWARDGGSINNTVVAPEFFEQSYKAVCRAYNAKVFREYGEDSFGIELYLLALNAVGALKLQQGAT